MYLPTVSITKNPQNCSRHQETQLPKPGQYYNSIEVKFYIQVTNIIELTVINNVLQPELV